MKTKQTVFPVLVVVSVLIAAVIFPLSVDADTPQTTSEQFPIDYRVANVCGDINEIIQLDGTLHVNSTVVAVCATRWKRTSPPAIQLRWSPRICSAAAANAAGS